MPKLSFFHNLHILFIFLLLELSASIRQGENGRYLYNDDLGFERYCHYCPPVAMYDSENNVLYQEPRCFEKNYPFHLKCDQEELERKLLPVCRYGTLPSCFLHKMPEDGYWNCTSSFFHNKTSDGYHIPVYTMCQLTCEQGFSPTGISNIYCRENRHWDLNPNTVACQKSVSADEPDMRAKPSYEKEGTESSKIRQSSGRQKYIEEKSKSAMEMFGTEMNPDFMTNIRSSEGRPKRA